MKKIIYSIGITFFATVLFTGCQPTNQEADETKADVESVKQELEDVKNETKQNAADLANAAEWKEYKVILR